MPWALVVAETDDDGPVSATLAPARVAPPTELVTRTSRSPTVAVSVTVAVAVLDAITVAEPLPVPKPDLVAEICTAPTVRFWKLALPLASVGCGVGAGPDGGVRLTVAPEIAAPRLSTTRTTSAPVATCSVICKGLVMLGCTCALTVWPVKPFADAPTE